MTQDKQPTSSAPHVYQAIKHVQAALAKEGVSKSRNNQQQGYKFRGIDEIFNALAPHLAEHGLCILPRILTREVTERTTAKGGVLFYVVVEAEYDFISVDDASKHTVRVYGEAMDSADKATNKAMSAAYKYACLQTFCIPTEGDNDADATTHEVQPVAPPAFENDARRIVFTDTLKRDFQKCKSVTELNGTIAKHKSQLDRMAASSHGADVAASNALRAEFKDCLKILEAAEKAAPRTVEAALKPVPLPQSVEDDEIPF